MDNTHHTVTASRNVGSTLRLLRTEQFRSLQLSGSRTPDRELRPLRCSGRCALAMVSAPQGSPSVGRFVEKELRLGRLGSQQNQYRPNGSRAGGRCAIAAIARRERGR
jgi:hypothetical protein